MYITFPYKHIKNPSTCGKQRRMFIQLNTDSNLLTTSSVRGKKATVGPTPQGWIYKVYKWTITLE